MILLGHRRQPPDRVTGEVAGQVPDQRSGSAHEPGDQTQGATMPSRPVLRSASEKVPSR